MEVTEVQDIVVEETEEEIPISLCGVYAIPGSGRRGRKMSLFHNTHETSWGAGSKFQSSWTKEHDELSMELNN